MARLLEVAVLERVEHLAVGFVGELRERRRATASCAAPALARTTAHPTLAPPGRVAAVSCGSMPRANSVSSRASMLGRPSPLLTSVLKLKPGRCPS